MRALAEVYAELCSTPSDINEHLPTFVQCAREVFPKATTKTMLELGVRDGRSTIAWLYGLHGIGRLWSVDARLPSGASPLRHVDLSGWTFILGDDESSVVSDILPSELDILFIDTSHTYRHTLAELERYGTCVRPGGLILLHDTMDNVSDVDYPVRRAIEAFTAPRGYRWTNHEHNNGLGIIEVGR